MIPMPRSAPILLALACLVLASCAAPPPQPARPPAQTPDPSFVPPEGITLQPGTRFMVRMWDSVNSKQHKAGHRFTATLEGSLMSDGKIVAPHGSVVYGVLSQSKSAGRVVGRSSMTLQPTSILIGSRMYDIVAGEIQAVASSGSGGKTVGRTARSAAVGGLIGGSSGAKTGAKIGVGASILSDDGQIQVASGALLEFPLVQPLKI
jgi:hypothetical protein